MGDFAEYPKWLYRGDNESVIVNGREEEDALLGDWYDRPILEDGEEFIEPANAADVKLRYTTKRGQRK